MKRKDQRIVEEVGNQHAPEFTLSDQCRHKAPRVHHGRFLELPELGGQAQNDKAIHD